MRKNSLSRKAVESIASMSYASLFSIWVCLTISLAMAYWLLSSLVPEHGPQGIFGSSMLVQFGNSLYFSVITATTTGYGDMLPQGFSKWLASGQSIISFFVFGVFMTKVVASRQEIALEKVHRLTYEDVFHNTREGLYIIRRDFDHLIARAESTGSLSEENWADLATAYKQGQTLLQEIPDFYDEDARMYVIDERREELLQEAVHRTLHRIGRMLDTFLLKQIDWMADTKSFAELQTFVGVLDAVMPHWQSQSPYQKPETFADIVRLGGGIRARLERTM